MRWRQPLCLLALALEICCCRPSPVPSAGEHLVTDLVGRTVPVKKNPSRFACIAGTATERLLSLGQGQDIVVAGPTNRSWSAVVDRTPHEIVLDDSGHAPNIEVLLGKRVGLIFHRNDPNALAKLSEAGLTAVVSQGFGGKRNRIVDSPEAFTTIVNDEVRLYGALLGGEAERTAAAWLAFSHARTSLVRKRIAALPVERRPKVYGIVGPSSTKTYGHDENLLWYVEMAGGRMVSMELPARGGITVSMEQIYLWNPEIVLVRQPYARVGRSPYSVASVYRDPVWKAVAAVRSKRVFPLPNGVDYWDRDSEGVLLLEYLAKKIHPALFADIDLKADVKAYYAKFYRTILGDGDVNAMLGE